MTEAVGTCPQCATALRSHETRLICDGCDGVLFGEDEYAASLRVLDGSNEKLGVDVGAPLDVKCPRCGYAMASCELSYGGVKLGGYKRCARDGVWVPNEGMIGAFAVVGHRRTGGRPVLDPEQSIWPGMRNIVGGFGGDHGGAVAMKSVANAFANRARFVSLGEILPRTRTAFVSAFSGKQLDCPTCKKALMFAADRWACGSCTGSFVEDAALVAMVQNMTHAYWEMPAAKGAAGTRTCPACDEPMSVERFQSVEIDRCKGHGVWFDNAELEKTLIESTDRPKETGGWLERLFGRKPS